MNPIMVTKILIPVLCFFGTTCEGNKVFGADQRLQLTLELRAFAQEISLGEPLPVVVTIHDDPQKPIKSSCNNSILSFWRDSSGGGKALCGSDPLVWLNFDRNGKMYRQELLFVIPDPPEKLSKDVAKPARSWSLAFPEPGEYTVVAQLSEIHQSNSIRLRVRQPSEREQAAFSAFVRSPIVEFLQNRRDGELPWNPKKAVPELSGLLSQYPESVFHDWGRYRLAHFMTDKDTARCQAENRSLSDMARFDERCREANYAYDQLSAISIRMPMLHTQAAFEWIFLFDPKRTSRAELATLRQEVLTAKPEDFAFLDERTVRAARHNARTMGILCLDDPALDTLVFPFVGTTAANNGPPYKASVIFPEVARQAKVKIVCEVEKNIFSMGQFSYSPMPLREFLYRWDGYGYWQRINGEYHYLRDEDCFDGSNPLAYSMWGITPPKGSRAEEKLLDGTGSRGKEK